MVSNWFFFSFEYLLWNNRFSYLYWYFEQVVMGPIYTDNIVCFFIKAIFFLVKSIFALFYKYKVENLDFFSIYLRLIVVYRLMAAFLVVFKWEIRKEKWFMVYVMWFNDIKFMIEREIVYYWRITLLNNSIFYRTLLTSLHVVHILIYFVQFNAYTFLYTEYYW